MIPTRREEVC